MCSGWSRTVLIEREVRRVVRDRTGLLSAAEKVRHRCPPMGHRECVAFFCFE